MNMRSVLAGAALLGTLLLPNIASATGGWVTTSVNMRAGPGTNYPAITSISGGVSLTIHGCTSSYDWCDCSWGGHRGWISAKYLQHRHKNKVVYVYSYGPSIGIPIISFSFGYFDRHYRKFPWYTEWRPHPRPPKNWEPHPGPVHMKPPGHTMPPGHMMPPGRRVGPPMHAGPMQGRPFR